MNVYMEARISFPSGDGTLGELRDFLNSLIDSVGYGYDAQLFINRDGFVVVTDSDDD